MISSVYRGVSGLSQDQQSQFRAQLAELRMECEQLQQENAGIKRNKANGRRWLIDLKDLHNYVFYQIYSKKTQAF